MNWINQVYLLLVFVYMFVAVWKWTRESGDRKRFETIVAKLRDKKALNEEETVAYMEAEQYDWLGNKLKKA